MAFVLRLNVEFGKSSLVVYDTTCVFDSGYNPGGYNGPNVVFDLNNIVAAEVQITPRGATTPIVIDVYPFLPSNEGNGYEIPIADLNLTEMPVGEWLVKYKITLLDTSTYEAECYFLNDCPVQCCIDSKTKSIDPLCDINDFIEIAHLNNMLKSAWSAHNSGEYSKANTIIDYVNEQCNCSC